MIKKAIWCGFFTIPLFFLHTFHIFPQESLHIKFDNLSLKDGLSQSSVNCIWQDSKGLMWFGTEDGLNKFDPSTAVFTRFNHIIRAVNSSDPRDH